MKYSEQPRVRAPPEEALRVGRRDRDARLLAPALRGGGHVLLERAAGPLAGVVLHLPHDFFPGADVRDAADRAHAVDLAVGDRKSTRLNSSHGYISYAVFCLKKKKETN